MEWPRTTKRIANPFRKSSVGLLSAIFKNENKKTGSMAFIKKRMNRSFLNL